VVRWVDGNIQLKKEYSDYSELEKTLARRTYDESGSYTTKPFEIDIRESLNTLGGPYTANGGGDINKLAVGLQAGKAYVFGYELETQGTQYVLVDKARETAEVRTQPMNNVKFGQYVKVKSGTTAGAKGVAGTGGAGAMTGGFGFTYGAPKILLHDPSGVTGVARVRHIIPNNDWSNYGNASMTGQQQSYNMYLFDIQLGGITSFGNVVKFGGGATLGSGSLTAGFVVATGGTNSNGTRLFEPSFNTSIFPVPIGNSVSTFGPNLTYSIIKSFDIVHTDINSIVELETGDSSLQFYASQIGEISATEKQNNYTLICGTGTGGNEIGGTGERVNTDGVRFEKMSGGQSIKIGWTDDTRNRLSPGSYTLHARVDVGGAIKFRNKTFTSGCSSTHIRTSDGNEPGLSGSTGSYYFKLGHHDIYDIDSIQDIGTDGNVATRLGLPASDVKEAFQLDNGQRDNYYDFGRLYLKPNYSTGGGVLTGDINLKATYTRFDHESGIGPFIANSYTPNNSNDGFSFDNIPIYISPTTGKSYSLRNSVDFRGTMESDDTISPNTLIPRPSNASTVVDYDHHLSRIDKIILTKERQFDIIRGISSLNPVEPPDREDAMTLYVLTIPSYTYNVGDVTSKFVENKRYTMKDVASIEKRVENLEYYTSLSLLEQETEGRSITDSSGNDIFKNGIMVDAFRGHSVGDVLNKDYVCSIDYENGHLRPSFTSNSLQLGVTASNSGITISSEGIVTKDYIVNGSFHWQPLASDSIEVNSFNIASWMGYIKFDDPFDEWYDTTNKPTVKINTQGENDRWKVNNENSGYGFGTQWNDWEILWSGRTVTKNDLYNNRGRDYLNAFTTGNTGNNIENRVNLVESSAIRSTETQKTNEGRVGVRVRKLPERLEKLVNDKLIDVSVVPYVRAKTITMSAYGMKPNTQVWPYFDGRLVSDNCAPAGGVSGDNLYTDSEGKISDIKFDIAGQTYRTGDRLFRLTDSSSNIVSSTTTAADGIYYAIGISPQRDGELVSTRPIVSRRQVANDEAIIRDAFDRERYFNTSTNNYWIDPLSQTFTVDRNQYSNGTFVHSLDLFFQQRDENVPITVEIRPTIGGYPHLSQSLPFSSVTKIPLEAEVQGDYPNEETYTRFTFDSPVYLTPGEYSICIKTSSSSYKLYTAEVGQAELGTGVIISESPHNGILYTPQNTGILIPNFDKSLKFRLNSCEFSAGAGSVEFDVLESEVYPWVNLTTDVLKVNSTEILPKTSSIDYTFDLANNVSVKMITNENIYLENPAVSTSNDFKLSATFNSTDINVSPVIDTKRLEFITINNQINNSTVVGSNGELDANAHDPDEDAYGSGTDNPLLTRGAASRYITRRVTLADGFESVNFKVLMSINKPSGASVQVFIKPLGIEDDTAFEEISYTQMTEDSTIPDSSNDYDFSDVTFSLSSTFDNPVKTFAIKICMYSDSSTNVPSIRDFRAIALAS